MAAVSDVLIAVFGSANIYIQLIRFFVVLFIGISIIRFVLLPMVRRIAVRRGTDKRKRHSAENIVGVVALFFVFTASLQAGNFGGLVTLIATIAAAATVAIGWGMRDQVSSIVSGVFLHISPPFVNGDYITVGEVQGIVKDSNMIDTRIRGPNGQKMVVPNNYLTTRPLANHTKGTITQDSLTVKIRPETLEEASYALKTIVTENDEVLDAPEPRILYSEIDGKTVTTELVYHVQDTQDIRQIKTQVIRRFNEKALENQYLAEPAEEDKSEEPVAS